MKNSKKYIRRTPEVLCLYIGYSLEFGSSQPKQFEKILTSPKFLTKSSAYDFLTTVFGEGLLFSSNQKWFHRRKIITPTFHFKILRQFFDVFQKQSKNLLKQFEKIPDGEIFDLTHYIGMTVLKSICGRQEIME